MSKSDDILVVKTAIANARQKMELERRETVKYHILTKLQPLFSLIALIISVISLYFSLKKH